MSETVNEESSAYLTITFKDKSGNPVSPTSAVYRIDDVDSGTEIRADTALASSSSVEITLTPIDNQILNNTLDYETKRVTVKAVYGASDGVNDQYEYVVKNLSKIS